MAELTQDKAAEPETRPVEFEGKVFETVRPTKDQMAVLIRMGFWRRNYGDTIDVEDKPQTQRQLAAVNRMFTLIASLFAVQADWDWIEDGMAAGWVDSEKVLEMLARILRAWNTDEEPTNRASKRAAAKKTTRRVAG